MPTRRLILAAALAGALSACAGGASMSTSQSSDIAAGTNRSFHHEVSTSASAAAVWRLWTDASTWKDWDQGLKDASLSGAMSLGSKGTILPKSGPASRFVVTEWTEGKSYAFKTSLPLASLTVRRTLMETSPVRFRHEVSFDGLLAGFWANQFGPQFRAALPPTMREIARLAEVAR